MVMMNLGLAPVPTREKSKARRVVSGMKTPSEEERLLSRTQDEVREEIAEFLSDGIPRGSHEVAAEVKLTINATASEIEQMAKKYPRIRERRIHGRRIYWMAL